MTAFKIPLTPAPQRFAITLGGMQLSLVCKWNESAGWMLDIFDAVQDVAILTALPLVTGVDLLGQHKHLGIPGGLFVMTDGDLTATPTYENIGAASNLYFWAEQ